MKMTNDTVTLALNGEVPLQQFAEAMNHFNALVNALSSEIAHDVEVEWVIDSLEAGSAVATVRAISEREDVVSSIIEAYTVVGKSLQANVLIPYSEKISKPAKSIAQMLNGKITSVRFETAVNDFVIASHYQTGQDARPPSYSFGTVKGVVQTLSRRRGIRFILYDSLFDRAISCYLKEGQEERIKEFWGKKVLVSGLIGRDAEIGKPFAIRDISQIRLAESSQPGSYQLAKGLFQLREGETSESVTRGLRDGYSFTEKDF